MQQSRTPTVSVVIPCHNYGRFLPEAVASVMAQTFTDVEIVIVDDGSTDDSATVAYQLAAEHHDRAIRVICRPNGGVSAARNTGIAGARGHYILPLDADDILAPTMLAETTAVLDDNPDVAIVSTDLCVFTDEQMPTQDLRLPAYDPALLRQRLIMFYCSLYRREAWEQTGGYDPAFTAGEDWEFWLNCAAHDLDAHHLPKVLVGIRNKDAGLHTHALDNDLALRAAIVAKHRKLFKPVTVAWADALLAVADGEPHDDPRVPEEILSRATETSHLLKTAARLQHTARTQFLQLREVRIRLAALEGTEPPPPAASRLRRIPNTPTPAAEPAPH